MKFESLKNKNLKPNSFLSKKMNIASLIMTHQVQDNKNIIVELIFKYAIWYFKSRELSLLLLWNIFSRKWRHTNLIFEIFIVTLLTDSMKYFFLDVWQQWHHTTTNHCLPNVSISLLSLWRHLWKTTNVFS